MSKVNGIRSVAQCASNIDRVLTLKLVYYRKIYLNKYGAMRKLTLSFLNYHFKKNEDLGPKSNTW